MKRIGIFMVYIFCLTGFRPLEAKEYNILDFGAVSDTGKLSTQAVQQAIDACHAAGGGMVLVPAGHFKIGSIVLRSYVDLHLESGAVLLGSKKLEDYIKLKPAYTSLRTQEATIQLIYAENAEQISITGLGEIDGQGSGFKKLDWNDEGITRPHLLRFITCTRVKIENISMKNAGCWMQHYLACENVQIRNIRVFNRNNYNNDALDLDGCRNVTVSGLIADSDDDGITLKSTSPKPCENISISNCVVSSRCNAIKMGTESNGGFRNISISNCVVKPSKAEAPGFFGQDGGTSAISLEIVDGGIMEGISISNIQVEGTEAPIFIRLGNRARSWKKDLPVDHVGELADVSISHVRVIRAGKTACSITGQPGYPVRNIRLSHIVVQSEGTGTAADFKREVAYLPRDYPEATMFGVLPAYGFYLRHAENVRFDYCLFTTKQADARPVFYLDRVDGCLLNGQEFSNPQGGDVGVYADHAKKVMVNGAVCSTPLKTLVKAPEPVLPEVTVTNPVMLRGAVEKSN